MRVPVGGTHIADGGHLLPCGEQRSAQVARLGRHAAVVHGELGAHQVRAHLAYQKTAQKHDELQLFI